MFYRYIIHTPFRRRRRRTFTVRALTAAVAAAAVNVVATRAPRLFHRVFTRLFGARRRPVDNTVARTPSVAFRFAGVVSLPCCRYRVGPVVSESRVFRKKQKLFFLDFSVVFGPARTGRATKWRPSRPASPPAMPAVAGRTCQSPRRSFATGTTTHAPRGRGIYRSREH